MIQHACVSSTLLSLMVSVTAISAQNLVCYYCLHSNDNMAIEEDQNQNPECLSKDKFSGRPDMRRTCALNETSCTSIVVNENGFFLTIQRDCAQNCAPGCFENGYGLFFTTCTRCCDDSLCNNFDGAAYYKPKSGRRAILSFSALTGLLVALQ